VVTAATVTVNAATPVVKGPSPTPTTAAASSPTPPATVNGPIDFAALREQISLEQVLSHSGILGELRGSGAQRRGRCPIHAAAGDRRRTFSVNLKKNVFQCFDPSGNAHGNVLDFWAALRGLPLVEAARQLAATFHLSSSPDTEKRNP
jgi:DNA primase